MSLKERNVPAITNMRSNNAASVVDITERYPNAEISIVQDGETILDATTGLRMPVVTVLPTGGPLKVGKVYFLRTAGVYTAHFWDGSSWQQVDKVVAVLDPYNA